MAAFAGSDRPDEVAFGRLLCSSCPLEEVIQQFDHILERISEDAAHVAQHIHPWAAAQLVQGDQLEPA